METNSGTDPVQTDNSGHLRKLILAGGCFWCHDAIFRQTRGIVESEAGYIGGQTPNPDYRQVCTGATGHAEAVRVVFDEDIIDADTVLDIFFATHDPTSLNRQGADAGTQYRSALFPATTEPQRSADLADFQAALQRHQHAWDAPIVTTIEEDAQWYPAEEEHQNFYAKHPEVGYCQVVINPKLAHFREHYSAWLA